MAIFGEFRFPKGDPTALEASGLSEVGCRIFTINTFPLGTLFRGVFFLYGEEVSVEGHVTRTVYQQEMTVRFTKVSPEGTALIRAWRKRARTLAV